MGEYAVSARSVEEVGYVSTGGNAVGARSAEGVVFVSMGGDAVGARSAEDAAFVSMDIVKISKIYAVLKLVFAYQSGNRHNQS